jgi:hypothetical protein
VRASASEDMLPTVRHTVRMLDMPAYGCAGVTQVLGIDTRGWLEIVLNMQLDKISRLLTCTHEGRASTTTLFHSDPPGSLGHTLLQPARKLSGTQPWTHPAKQSLAGAQHLGATHTPGNTGRELSLTCTLRTIELGRQLHGWLDLAGQHLYQLPSMAGSERR